MCGIIQGHMDRFQITTQNLEEIITPEDLKALLDSDETLNHYIGFEISGKIHLGTGLQSMKKVRDFARAGFNVHIFLADWHTWINDKLGGDRDLIKEVAVGYFREGLTASYQAVGGNPHDLNFVLGSNLYHQQADEYWAVMIDVAKHTSLARMQRSIDILGRGKGDSVDFAKLIYPAMQVADIFIQDIHLAHAGTDQRKAHVIMRDVADKLKIHPLTNREGKIVKPVGVHHHLILGLAKPTQWPVPEDQLRNLWADFKMSKSKPESAVFITDDPDQIRKKIQKAFCPPNEIRLNPIIDWVEHLILDEPNQVFKIVRDQVHGGPVTYTDIQSLKQDYLAGKLHPQDLKNAVAEKIINILKPVRDYFQQEDRQALVQQMDKLAITR